MNTPLTIIAGPPSQGAEILREQLRWAAAERRWHPPQHLTAPAEFDPPPASGQQALWDGALLAEFGQVAISQSERSA